MMIKEKSRIDIFGAIIKNRGNMAGGTLGWLFCPHVVICMELDPGEPMAI